MSEWAWDGVGNPYEIVREAREEAGRVGIGMSQWKGMGWGFWVYTPDGLTEVFAGDTVVLEDDLTITVRRADHGV